jgi:hypothetical protein
MSTLFVDTINEKTSGNGVAIPGHVVQYQGLASWSNTQANSSSSWTTAETVSITPKFSNSKILFCFNFMSRLRGTASSEQRGGWRVIRSTDDFSTTTAVFNTIGSVETQHIGQSHSEFDTMMMVSGIDEPGVATEVKYRIQGKIHSSGTSWIEFIPSTFGGQVFCMEIAQ